MTEPDFVKIQTVSLEQGDRMNRSYIEELYSAAAPLALESAGDFVMCDCCDWGYAELDSVGWTGEPEGNEPA